jgi:hypothetical protein
MGNIYRVSFFKKLTDSTGHPVDACQGTVEVQASSEDSAIGVARRAFAELKDVGEWSLRADYEAMEFLPERKRVSASVWRRSLRDYVPAH